MEELFKNIQLNQYQTPLTEDFLSQYPDEVQEQAFEFLTSIEFLKRLISPNRRYARDCPRDEKGRIIVDLTNPHICEDTDYFRQPAIHYLKHKCYTFLKPNSNPHSEYRKHWDEEIRRCREGYVRESDGEWVTGFCYWFLNYNPMLINEIQEGKKKAIRKEGFPYFFEGIYWRFHYLWQAREAGKHAIELAKRGVGKSYSLSSIMTHNLILGESEESKRRVTTVLTAYQKEYLKGDKDGTLSKFQPSLSFLSANTPFPRLMLKASPNEMSWRMGYLDEYNRECGSFNMVLAVSAKDDSGKLRGKRGWILFEEMGQFKNLDALYDVTRKSVEDGDYTFATMYLVGTASDNESDFSSAKKLLQSPEGHNILALENVFDKPKQGSKMFGFFYGACINRAGCCNKDGVSDVIKALFQVLMARYNAKYNNVDPQSLLRQIAEDPITPAEAIVKVKAAYFPVAQLNERILQIDSNPRFYDNVLTGDLVLNNGKVDFRPSNGEPIRKWGVDNDTPGCIEIFDLPEKDSEGNIPNTRYIGGVDSYDNDQAESCSLYSIFIFDLFTDNIVAEFTGRTDYADDAHEIARKLALLYNARMMFESNKKGWYAYFAKMNSTHLLAETPQYLRDQQMIKYQAFGSNKYGINASAAINNYGNDLLRQWLISPRTAEIEGEDGKPFQTTIPTLYTIRNRALLDEAANFDGIHNFDRISAMAQVMLYRQEKIILYQGDMSRTVNNYEDKDYAGNDDFFTQNYDEKFNIDTRGNYYGWQ